MIERPDYLIDSLPVAADVVIVGAGIVGVSAAYELTRRGVADVVVVDRGELFRTGGSTSHAPGGIFQNNGSRTVSKLAQESVATFLELNADGDGSPVYFDTGSIEVATTEARWRDLHRKLGYARAWGLEAALLSPDEVAARLPLINAGAILGGIAVKGDGVLRAIPFVERLAARAGAGGARFLGGTRVTGFDRSGGGGRVVAVETDRGRIEAGQVLICAGIWGPVVGERAGIRIPLQPCAHPYVRSTPLPELSGRTYPREPIWRHQDHSMYLTQWDDRYVVGSYRHEPLIVDAHDIDDAKAAPADLPFDDHIFEPSWREAQRLVPALRGAGQTDRVYGMFSFTPDANSLIGEVASVPGLFLAEAVWVTHGPGAGRLAADLMVSGECSEGLDLREVDPNRFAGHQLAARYVRTRGAQNYREVYDVIHPRDQISEPRGMRRSPFHGRQVELGAVFTESGGWERPQWFAANAGLPVPASGERDEWSRYRWSPTAAAEHVATRERAGLFDLSTFQKIELSGSGALAALERLSCSVVDRPVGRVTYALFLNERGGIESDLTVTRLAEDRFLLLCGASSGPRDLGWIRRQTRGMAGVEVRDVTSAWCGLGLWGPVAHAILELLVEHPRSLDIADFPLFTSREMDVAGTPATLLRLSYVGEYGWEVHVPTEYGGALWDAVWESGQAHGLVACGGAAMDTLRLEKGYRALGTDLRAEHGPVAAGLGFAVRRNWEGGGGRKEEGRTDGGSAARLCALVVEDGTVVIGKEPVLDGERVVGYVASAGFGPTVGASIVTAYLPVVLAEPGTRLHVEWFGVSHAATVVREPLYDPDGVAMRAGRVPKGQSEETAMVATMTTTTWSNWAGNVTAEPRRVVRPGSVVEVQAVVREASSRGEGVRVAGAGHSFSPLCATEGTLIDLSGLNGIEGVDPATGDATILAGTHIWEIGGPLLAVGRALANQGDIDRQALAGAVSTGTHGTGRKNGSFASAVRALELVTADGEVRWVGGAGGRERGARDETTDVVQRAAALSLGMLGVITRVRLATVPAYKLREQTMPLPFEACLEEFPAIEAARRNAEFWWLPGHDLCVLKSFVETDDEPFSIETPEYPPGTLERYLKPDHVEWGWKIYPSARTYPFVELEYTLPLAAGPDALRAIRELVLAHYPDMTWAIEYRTMAGEDPLLSPTAGEDSVTISVHQAAELPYEAYFRDVEAICLAAGGRPHWGKLHWLDRAAVDRAYPGVEAFRSVRRELDPSGVFLNEHLQELFG